MALILVIGNKNYSSWSFRPWIAMKVAGIAFDEVVISLDAPDFKSRVSKIAGTGKVPALDDNGIHVWESLAILEYLAERFPAAQLWPADAADFKSRVSKISGTGKVPALDDNGVHVWESLAILEYLAERFPAAKL